MTFLLVLPSIVAVITLAAHYARFGAYFVSVLLLALLPLLLIDRKWVARMMEVVLALAALEWVLILVDVIGQRNIENRDFSKTAIILGATALFSLVSALLYETPRLRRRYHPDGAA
jgi:hypothetical protein